MTGAKPARRGKVIYGITAGLSADKLLRGQLAWLREQGWDVQLAVNPDASAEKAAAREQVRLVPLPMSREIAIGQDLRSLVAWLRLVARARPDAVNVSTPKAGLLGGFAAWALRVPRRVYVMRGLRVEGTSGTLGKVLWLMERLSTAFATDVVVVSKSLGQEARTRRLVGRRVWLVGEGSSNGVRADEVRHQVQGVDPLSLRRDLGIDDDVTVVGYIGRITADKGIEVLVEAIRRMPSDAPVRLLTVGPVEDGPMTDELESLGDRVVSVGWTDEPWRYYAAMDVLCLPTRREGYPNVVLEAGAAGVPTVTTRATGAVDSVVDHVTGLLVDVDDADGLSSALQVLVADPSLRQRLGKAARDRADRDYRPELIWEGIDSILRGTPNGNTKAV